MRRIWQLAGGLLLLTQCAAQAQFTYATNGSAITLTGYAGSGGAVTISNFVTAIGGNAFFECPIITNLTIPDSVTSIDGSAFYNSSVNLVTIPNSVTNIGVAGFAACSLTSGAIPDSITRIGESVFDGCAALTTSRSPIASLTSGCRLSEAVNA